MFNVLRFLLHFFLMEGYYPNKLISPFLNFAGRLAEDGMFCLTKIDTLIITALFGLIILLFGSWFIEVYNLDTYNIFSAIGICFVFVFIVLLNNIYRVRNATSASPRNKARKILNFADYISDPQRGLIHKNNANDRICPACRSLDRKTQMQQLPTGYWLCPHGNHIQVY
ncbi:MAG: hypothetical protein KJ658_17670, partial [Proteobacteria bacterium]|nr:hypothetical protein [Pseudomonadota bacterium]